MKYENSNNYETDPKGRSRGQHKNVDVLLVEAMARINKFEEGLAKYPKFTQRTLQKVITR